MNLTLLPTDLAFTDKNPAKSQSTLNEFVNGNPSSPFGQLLNTETAFMRKSTVQTDKNSLKEGKITADKTTEGAHSQLQPVSDNTVIKDKLRTEVSLQDNEAEFAVLKDEDLLSAEALSAVIPIQIAGLVNSVRPQEGTENVIENDLQDDENSTIQALLGKNAKDVKVSGTALIEQSEEGEPDEGIRLSAVQHRTLSNKKKLSANALPVLASTTGQVKLATRHGAEYSSTLRENSALNNNKELNLIQTAFQGAPALSTVTPEITSIDSPAVLATSPLLSGGQQTTGQFQLSNTMAPLLNAHLGSEEWQQQFNQHILFFNRNGLQQAELRLHPQELGALHIRMSVEDNQAQLHFVSAHQQVRAALEAALPGLRHSLAESGIQLAQSSVNSDSQGSWQQEHHANNQNKGSATLHADAQRQGIMAATGVTSSHNSAIRLTPQQLASTRGGVDTFA